MGGAVMQLGWPWSRKQREPALDVVPLKKIIAVSDEYWEALYSPIIDSVARSLGVYEKQKGKLYSDYVDQFVRLVRRSKGTVQDDPLLVHLHTFSLSIAFSSLYVARLCHSFEFTAISKGKKTKGERSHFYPWMNVPVECEIKLSKVSRLYPAYVYAISIFNAMMNDTGWKWLHSKPDVLKGLIDSIYSNGEKGLFSGILADMRAAPIGRSVENIPQVEISESVPVENEDPEKSDSLDDLISGLGGGDDSVSLDELLESSNQSKQTEENKPVASEEVSSNDGLDLSIFDNEPDGENTDQAPLELQDATDNQVAPISDNSPKVVSSAESKSSTQEEAPVNSSADALDEFTAFLAATTSSPGPDHVAETGEDKLDPNETQGTSKVPISDVEPSDSSSNVDNTGINEDESTLLFSSESSITTDLLKWCLAQVSEFPSQNGVHVLMRDNKKVIVVERDKGVMEFVRSDYDLDNEAAYKTVAEEVLTDLEMSQSWVENEEGGDIWEISIQDEVVNVLLLNVQVPSSFQSLDANTYAWVVKRDEIA
ncbi:hypothetical protein PSH47_16260 [Pseudoalteromonas sp. CST5]|uniref:hypothetical protein n=1 Tax=unclassified Pseudoalteromonas TaxID=194690 RepID=UPI00235A1ED4|nr:MULTISPECIES: hypothetical protein [unclassified Pseudoalteromonas]MDC9514435.1 hypothetical protein [Pseudoalteromonas sp. CST1]MDC9538881.1 hypothetical protein [Pseudoalteromonas sp. CST3]MDC9543092.1 hypothetical protein [Pseudoalteromonas sp. CST2]MDC9545910.1 hypothetical protein [Pseudoalteromonas sp. CST4]MDC9550689.1 hypothetical protein [Pseudoalteromonas sp. CST5]